MTIRTQLRAGAGGGAWKNNHNETLAVRTALKAGKMRHDNHNEAMQTRTGLKAGARKNVRAGLMVRAGLRAGRAPVVRSR